MKGSDFWIYEMISERFVRWYYVSKKELPILFSKLPYKMGNYFLDRQ